MKFARTVLACSVVLIALATVFAQDSTLPPLRVYGAMTTIELSPVLVAANGIYPGPVTVSNGGVPNLTSGTADVATNAETQLLRQSVDDPDLRIIFTVTESFYRIVGRKSAGIQKVADLKGKRVSVPLVTGHYTGGTRDAFTILEFAERTRGWYAALS